MDKLSELSKPIGIAFKSDIELMQSGRMLHGQMTVWRGSEENQVTQGVYSQEYVSTLLAERDAFEASALTLRDEWRASKKSNAFLKEQLAKLANFNPDWDMLEACRESWCEVAAALKEAEARLEAKDKRIAELEAEAKVWESAAIKHLARAEEAEKRLATPVRLPETYSPEPWMGPDPSGTWLDKEDVKKSIRTAGFTVEGDE
ncbi:TPA: hypothetical protein ACGD77_002983 [Serratia marcescens]